MKEPDHVAMARMSGRMEAGNSCGVWPSGGEIEVFLDPRTFPRVMPRGTLVLRQTRRGEAATGDTTGGNVRFGRCRDFSQDRCLSASP